MGGRGEEIRTSLALQRHSAEPRQSMWDDTVVSTDREVSPFINNDDTPHIERVEEVRDND